MSLMARMLELKNATTATLPESRGPASVVTGESGDYSRMLELWGAPGYWSLPPDGTFGIRVPVGGSDRWGAVIATQHYKTPRPTLAKGETAIGSTNAAGTTLMARATFYADGKIALSNATKDLLTLLNGLIDVIKGLTTAGTAAAQAIDPASQALLEAYKVQLGALLKVPV